LVALTGVSAICAVGTQATVTEFDGMLAPDELVIVARTVSVPVAVLA
jgi:hypothetical protein